MSSQKIIKDFIANIIDIYDENAINTFINNGNINIDNVRSQKYLVLVFLNSVLIKLMSLKVRGCSSTVLVWLASFLYILMIGL